MALKVLSDKRSDAADAATETPEAPSWKELLDAIHAGEAAKVGRWLRAHPHLAEAKEPSGVSALLVAAYRRQPEIVDLFLAARRELDVFEAAACGRIERLRELVADPSQGDRRVDAVAADGFRPLGLAAFFGHRAAVELLLERGADPALASDNVMRVTPLHSAVAQPDAGLALELARRLVDAGAAVDAEQAGGWRPLHQAAAHGHCELVELLLARGADPTATSDGGKTAADLAAERGHGDLATRLLGAAGTADGAAR